MTGSDVPPLLGVGHDVVKLGLSPTRDNQLEVSAHGGDLVVTLGLPFPEEGPVRPMFPALEKT